MDLPQSVRKFSRLVFKVLILDRVAETWVDTVVLVVAERLAQAAIIGSRAALISSKITPVL